MREIDQLKRDYMSIRKKSLIYISLVQKNISDPKVVQLRQELIQQAKQAQEKLKELEGQLL